MRKLGMTKSSKNIDKIKNSFYVFDVETTCLEPMSKNFVFGVVWGWEYKKVIYSVEDFKKEFDYLRYKKKYVFAHNAEFDLMTIYGNIITQVDNSAIFNGKFISATLNDVTFGDSMNIYPSSVAKIGLLLGMLKGDNKKVKAGGLRKDNITEEDVEYCIQDCRIVWTALRRIFEEIGDVKLTLASLSMYQFRSKYMKQDFNFSELVDEFYESYYGGRTEAFRLGRLEADVYDINSLYPFVMREAIFPDIKALHKIKFLDLKYLNYILYNCEGLARVTVRHKPTYFGYLPCRMEVGGSEKLVFPVGKFTTTVNFNELRFAVDAGVVEILSVDYAVYGQKRKSPFVEFVDDNYKKRVESESELDKVIYKLIMNSLYGRFGMKMKMMTTYYNDLPVKVIQDLQEADKYYEIKVFSSERNDCYLITENEKMKNAFFSIPLYSSYITSAARIILLQNLIANENNGVCYCDTDSIFVSGSFEGSVGNTLGAFKMEKKRVTAIYGLKNYVYIDVDGKEIPVIKGVSRDSVKKVGEETYYINRYHKTKAALRNGCEAGSAYTMTKELKHIYDKRVVLPLGETKAIDLDTFVEVGKAKKVSLKNYDPDSYYEAILMFFVSGGMVKKKDVFSYITGKSSEIKKYNSIMSEGGVSMDTFNDHVSELLAVERPIDEFEVVLSKFYNRGEMEKELKRLRPEIDTSIKKPNIRVEYDVPF